RERSNSVYADDVAKLTRYPEHLLGKGTATVATHKARVRFWDSSAGYQTRAFQSSTSDSRARCVPHPRTNVIGQRLRAAAYSRTSRAEKMFGIASMRRICSALG